MQDSLKRLRAALMDVIRDYSTDEVPLTAMIATDHAGIVFGDTMFIDAITNGGEIDMDIYTHGNLETANDLN